MVYELEGLDCAHCAAKIEHEIQKLEGLSEATVNFATRTIEIDPDFEQDVAEVLQRVEPHVKLVPKKSASEKREEMAEKSKAMPKTQASQYIFIRRLFRSWNHTVSQTAWVL